MRRKMETFSVHQQRELSLGAWEVLQGAPGPVRTRKAATMEGIEGREDLLFSSQAI